MFLGWLFSWRTSNPDSPTLLERIANLPVYILLGTSLAIFIGLALIATEGDSCTNDEVVHVSAGYTHTAFHDFRLNPEHPPLAKILAAIPLLVLDVHLPKDDCEWDVKRQWDFGYHFLNHTNDPDKLLWWSRMPIVIWGAFLVASIYSVARQFYGATGGLIALVLATFCPEFLAHGHLVTTDLPVASFFLLTVTAFWKLLESGSIRWVVYTGFLLGGALLTKFSAILLVPILAWLALTKALVGRPSATRSDAGQSHEPKLTTVVAAWLGRFVVIALLALVLMWAMYGFRYSPSSDPSVRFDWSFLAARQSLLMKCVGVAREVGLLPESYLYGLSYMHEQSGMRRAFAFGLYSDVGWWWFFPLAFLVKTPLSMLLLFGWGIWAVFRRPRIEMQFIIVPLVMYWVLAMSSNMNIGLRHLLPVYPLHIVLAAGIALQCTSFIWRMRLVLAILVCTALGCIWSVPYFLAHFNAPALMFFDRHAMLVDSSLDWGQDLKRLKKYMADHGIKTVKLAYFGNASPRRIELRHTVLLSANMYSYLEPEWQTASAPAAGDIVAISATNLVGLYLEDRNYYLPALRNMHPMARIGHSILLYRIPDDN